MPSKKTLKTQFAELRSMTLRKANNSEKAIRASYKELLNDLQSFVGGEYARLSKEGKLTYSILQQKGEYARFLEECTKRIDGISPKITKQINDLVEETYELTYKGMVDAVSTSKDTVELEQSLKSVRANIPQTVKRNVENPIAKLTLKDTLENKRHEITYNIRKQVGIGLVNGDRYETMAKRIADTLDGDYKKAIRVVRTEAHKVREQGINDAAVDCSEAINKGKSGLIMVKTWHTGKDGRVRDTHADMEGVTVLADEEFKLTSGATTLTPGDSGVASEDINCRCYCSYDLMTVEEYEKKTGNKYNNILEKANDYYGIGDLTQPTRPKKDDFGGLTDEYYEARDKYRKEHKEYSSELDNIVQKNLNRPQKFNSKSEVEAWADNIGIKISNGTLDKIDIRVFDDLADTTEEMFSKYPFLRKEKIHFVSLGETVDYQFTLGIDDDSYALMSANGGLRLGKFFGNYETALSSALGQMASGFNVRGDGTIKTLFRHEFGHNVDIHIKASLKAEEKIEYSKELRKMIECKGTSEYAMTNESEFFAEAFAEYASNGNTELAKEFGKFLAKWLR